MKKFLVLYRSNVSAGAQMASATPEQAKAGMDAWMAWASKAGAGIVDMGAPVDRRAALGADPGGAAVSGYGLVQADTPDAARRLMDGHPHLQMPGASIELLEVLPLPGM
jgi:hypothetical protein